MRMRMPFTAGLDSATIGPDRSCAVPTRSRWRSRPVAPAPARRQATQAQRRVISSFPPECGVSLPARYAADLSRMGAGTVALPMRLEPTQFVKYSDTDFQLPSWIWHSIARSVPRCLVAEKVFSSAPNMSAGNLVDLDRLVERVRRQVLAGRIRGGREQVDDLPAVDREHRRVLVELALVGGEPLA